MICVTARQKPCDDRLSYCSGVTDNSLVYHLKTAKENGITQKEIAEILTHAAFYAGWPKAWAAFNLAKTVWTEEE